MGKGCGRKKAVTLKDIAKKTGFSVNTVSHALADKPDISADTKALICKKADEMGYIANASASFLRSGISKTVSIIVGDISNPHFSIMVKEMQTLLHRQKYTTIIFNTEEKKENERQAIVTSISQNVDGILICPAPGGKENIALLETHGVPFILIGRRLPGVKASYVVCDDEHGGYIATRHLLENGHRDILFLNGDKAISSAKERLRGHRRALEEGGLPYRESRVNTVALTTKSSTKMEQILREVGGFGASPQKCTAILAFSDILAWQAITLLAGMGASVPGACSIIGFDNIQSRFFYPLRLSSVSSSKTTLAKRAVQMMLEAMAGGAPQRQQVVLDTRLIEGDTVARLG